MLLVGGNRRYAVVPFDDLFIGDVPLTSCPDLSINETSYTNRPEKKAVAAAKANQLAIIDAEVAKNLIFLLFT